MIVNTKFHSIRSIHPKCCMCVYFLFQIQQQKQSNIGQNKMCFCGIFDMFAVISICIKSIYFLYLSSSPFLCIRSIRHRNEKDKSIFLIGNKKTLIFDYDLISKVFQIINDFNRMSLICLNFSFLVRHAIFVRSPSK